MTYDLAKNNQGYVTINIKIVELKRSTREKKGNMIENIVMSSIKWGIIH